MCLNFYSGSWVSSTLNKGKTMGKPPVRKFQFASKITCEKQTRNLLALEY